MQKRRERHHKKDPTIPLPPSNEELGEGNKTAAKRYNAGVRQTIEDKNIDKLATEAAKALDGPEGKALKAAEEKGKRGPMKNV